MIQKTQKTQKPKGAAPSKAGATRPAHASYGGGRSAPAKPATGRGSSRGR